MKESLALRGSRSLPIVIIALVTGWHVKARMRPPSLCMTQLSLQVVYLSLHGLFVILSLGYVTAHTRMAFTSLGGLHTSLSKLSILFILITFRVGKVTLFLGSSQFRLMGACSIKA